MITAFRLSIILLGLSVIIAFPSQLIANQDMPPANVAVSHIAEGMVAPEKEFIGTVYYIEVSDVSTEVGGTVKAVFFEEGELIPKGGLLVQLATDLLAKKLQSQLASYEQTLAELSKAEKDRGRMETLFKKTIISEKVYEDHTYLVTSLGKKALALKADVEHLEMEIEKASIKAPYSGIVLHKNVSRGEWISPGHAVATLAVHNEVDVVVNVPEDVVRHIKKGLPVEVIAGTTTFTGQVQAVIPRGDVATRTFPVKIRVRDSSRLFEGMQAKVKLPVGNTEEAFLVPRDAVLNIAGQTVLTAVVDDKAVIIPVRIIGYKNMQTGVSGDNISAGMQVVVKGNERLREGQPVSVIEILR